MSVYDWNSDPFLNRDGFYSCDQSGEFRDSTPPIDTDAVNAHGAEELFGKMNVYKKTKHTGNEEYDARVNIGDAVVFRRPGYYSQAFTGMDGERVEANTNHVMYTVIGKNPPVYGILPIEVFGPTHEPIGPRLNVKEVAQFNAERHPEQHVPGARSGAQFMNS